MDEINGKSKRMNVFTGKIGKINEIIVNESKKCVKLKKCD